jgi:hypothetical protein
LALPRRHLPLQSFSAGGAPRNSNLQIAECRLAIAKGSSNWKRIHGGA